VSENEGASGTYFVCLAAGEITRSRTIHRGPV
jgi:hypothetical protein